MNRILVGVLALALGALPTVGQSLDDLNIQIHGYATQGFLYTAHNNILTANSINGSPAWTEAVVNLTAQPNAKLRIGVQGRYFLLGTLGNAITLDWAAADYRASERFGVRFGKVKTPAGLFNELQDIDPSYMWSLLPQGVYPITSRNSLLSHLGGVVYGTIRLDPHVGKIEYRGFGGERVLAADDGYFIPYRDQGFSILNGMTGATYGGALHWLTPLPGLMVGVSDFKDTLWTPAITYTIPPAVSALTGIPAGAVFAGVNDLFPLNEPSYFGRYERGRFMLAAEHMRLPALMEAMLTQPMALPPITRRMDQRSWYGMFSYKVTDKFSAGIYDSQSFDRQVLLGPARYSKDWVVSGRYDLGQYIYAKAEQHFIEGEEILYDTAENPNGLQPSTKLTILKIGVSF